MEENYQNYQQPADNPESVPVTPPVPVAPPGLDQPRHQDGGIEDNTIVEDRIFAALSYISILFVVPLILKNENEDIHFHAKQGLVLFGTELAVWFVLFLFDTFLSVIFPSTELFLVRILGALAWLGFMALSLTGIYAVARGKRWVMPIIGRIAGRIKI